MSEKALSGASNPAFRHGHSKRGEKSKTYLCWTNMIARCYTPSSSRYKSYGARGIKVSESWKDFKNFLQDMGESPLGLQLDRIKVNEDYSKDNCRWVSPRVNANNKRHKSAYGQGVYRNNKSNTFMARVTFNYKPIYLGNFKSPEEASKVVQNYLRNRND